MEATAKLLEHPNNTIAAARRVDADRQNELAARFSSFQKDFPARPARERVTAELEKRAERPVVLAENEIENVRHRLKLIDDVSKTLEAERDILIGEIQTSRDARIEDQRADIRRAQAVIERAEGNIADIKAEASEERRLCITKYSDDLEANKRMKAAETAKLAALEGDR